MADLLVVDEFYAYLLAQSVAQRPSVAESLTVPSIWKDPRDGAPEPRRDKTTGNFKEKTTITLRATWSGPPPVPGMEAIEETMVDVIVRAENAATAQLTQRQIRALIAPGDQPYAKRQWTMGALLVEYSSVWRADQPLPVENQLYARVQSFRFGCRRKALAGQPLLP